MEGTVAGVVTGSQLGIQLDSTPTPQTEGGEGGLRVSGSPHPYLARGRLFFSRSLLGVGDGITG